MSYEFGSLSASEQTCAAMLLHLCGLQEPPVSVAEEKRSSVKLASDESHGSAYAWMNYDTDASGADADSGTGSVASTAVDQEERFDPGGTDSQHSDASSDNGARLEKLRRAEKGRRKRSVRFAPSLRRDVAAHVTVCKRDVRGPNAARVSGALFKHACSRRRSKLEQTV